MLHVIPSRDVIALSLIQATSAAVLQQQQQLPSCKRAKLGSGYDRQRIDKRVLKRIQWRDLAIERWLARNHFSFFAHACFPLLPQTPQPLPQTKNGTEKYSKGAGAAAGLVRRAANDEFMSLWPSKRNRSLENAAIFGRSFGLNCSTYRRGIELLRVSSDLLS